MNWTTLTSANTANEEANAMKASTPNLVHAEVERALRTRSTTILLLIAAVITLAIFTVRIIVSRGSEEPLSSDLIVLSADVVGFIIMLSTGLAVARDHQSGSIELVRVLVPARGRQLLALATAHAFLAVSVVIVVATLGTAAVLTVGASTFEAGVLANSLVRLLLTTALLAFAGAGVGAFCRSSAAATFVMLTLYLLMPIALIIAGFAGQAWASVISDRSLGLLSSIAISNSSDSWAATAGVALWAFGLILVGILRETKGK